MGLGDISNPRRKDIYYINHVKYSHTETLWENFSSNPVSNAQFSMTIIYSQIQF